MERLFWIALLLLIGWLYQQAVESTTTRREGRRQRWFDAEAMPGELQSATRYASEQRPACRWPVALIGRPDPVYRLADGSLLPVETKTRDTARAYEADVVQLSVYRALLINTDAPRFAGRRVCPRAYVRIRTPDGVVYRKVTLYAQDAVVTLHERYRALREGRAVARYSDAAGLCRQCGHRGRCERPAV